MQGRRSTLEPFCEGFEFELGSSSSNLGLDQDGFQNNGARIPLENQNSSAYPLSSGDSSTPSGNVAGLQSPSLISWMSVGPSSNLYPENPNNHNEVKLQNDWASSSLTCSLGGRQVTEEQQTQPINILSTENLDIDLNINHVENAVPFPEISDLNRFPQNVGVNSQILGSGFHSQPHIPGTVQPQLSPTPSGFSVDLESTSRTVHNFQDNGGNRQGLLLGGRCSLHKRKGIEFVAGQCSASGSSSNMNRGASIPPEDINTRLDIATRVPPDDLDTSSSIAGNQEAFLRNTRMRMNQPMAPDSSTSNILPQGNVITCANNWSDYQSSAPVPPNQLLESSLLGGQANPHTQPNVSTFPALSSSTLPIFRGGVSTSMVGSSSNPPVTGERSATEESNLRSHPRNNITEHPFIFPAVDTRDREQDPTNAGLSNRTTVVSGGLSALRARSVFAAYQPPGTSASSSQQRRRLSDNIRRSFRPSTSDPRGQNVNLPPHLGHFPSPLEVGRVPARANLPSFMTVPPILPDRQNEGAAPMPLPARHAGRNRNPSEMIYMTDVFRRIDPSLLEDVLLFEQSVFFGAAAEFHDRHRELRLDVDNMSYEELLALEERIGNVNTGLDEEKIKKSLKQRKYILVTSEASPQDEPCCICQEEYAEGEDLGQLDCGHDFHTACIKKWLLIKNSCPICKNNAVTT